MLTPFQAAHPAPSAVNTPVVRNGEHAMELRWVILLALWSLLVGPVFDCSHCAPTGPHAAKPAKVKSRHTR